MKWNQIFADAIVLGLFAVPFALALAMPGKRSLAVCAVLGSAMIAWMLWPLIGASHCRTTDNPKCGLGEVIALVAATLFGFGLVAGIAGRIWTLSKMKSGRWLRYGPVIAAGLFSFAGIGWVFRPFFF